MLQSHYVTYVWAAVQFHLSVSQEQTSAVSHQSKSSFWSSCIISVELLHSVSVSVEPLQVGHWQLGKQYEVKLGQYLNDFPNYFELFLLLMIHKKYYWGMNVLKQDMPEQVWEPLLYSNSLSVHFMTEENLKTNHIKLQATKHKLHWQCRWII